MRRAYIDTQTWPLYSVVQGVFSLLGAAFQQAAKANKKTTGEFLFFAEGARINCRYQPVGTAKEGLEESYEPLEK